MASQAHKHIDYLNKFADMQVPVIPGTVTFIDPKTQKPRKGGKTPGELGAKDWFPSQWRDYGTVSRKQALRWDRDGAGVGLRLGIRGHHALDVDITHAGLAGTVRVFLEPLLPMIRSVDHPDHHKFMCLLGLTDFGTGEPINLSKFSIHFTQPDGDPGKIEILGDGQYVNVEGIHQDRFTPYVWDRHPLEHDVPILYEEDWRDLITELRDILALGGATNLQVGSSGTTGGTTPAISQNRVSEEDLRALLAMIKNDARFKSRAGWMRIFHAVWVASDGQPYGREAWSDWCETIEQENPDEPGRVWDAGSANPNSPGLSALLIWAQQTGSPADFTAFQQRAAKASFDIPDEDEPEPGFVADTLAQFEAEWVYVSGEHSFYHVPSSVPHGVMAFAMKLEPIEKILRLAWGAQAGKKKKAEGSLPKLFRRFHPDRFAEKVVSIPGQPLLFSREGARCFNLWRPLPRPHADKPVTPDVLDRYIAHCAYVLGGVEAAERWLKWHAFLLQHPAEPPGWHWIVMGLQGLGKDQMAAPFALVHARNGGHKPLMASSLKSSFNEYAAKRFIIVSELRQMSGAHDAYNELKAVTSQTGTISINPKGRPEYIAINVAALVMFSNEPSPIYLDNADRRFYVLNSLSVPLRSALYYENINTLVTEHADEIAEYCYRLELSAEDYRLLRGRAPMTQAKAVLADETMSGLDHALETIFTDLSTGANPVYRPVFSVKDITSWIRDDFTPVLVAPRYGRLYAAGFRPVAPVKDNPKQAAPYRGNRLWRVQNWVDAKGLSWDLNRMSLRQLYRNYKTSQFNLAIVEDDDDEADEADKN